jgi:HK97 family phage portal protein
VLSRIFQNPGSSEEDRAISFQSVFAAGDGLLLTSQSGVAMNQDEALKLNAVYACVRLIADSIATLPVDTYFRIDGARRPFRPRPAWIEMPEVGVSRATHFQQVLFSLLIDGNAFVNILRDDQGIAGLSVLNPRLVEVRRDRVTRRPEYVIDNGRFTLPHDEVIHLTEMLMPGELRGRSRIDMLRETLALGKALDSFAQLWFGQGSQVGGIIEFPGNLTREQAKDLVDTFESKHKSVRKAHRPGVLFGGAKYVKTTSEPNESQFLESREFQIEEIARAFRIPPAMISVTKPGAMSYASVEQNGINLVTYTLRPYLEKIEQEYSNRLLPGEAFMKFTVDGLLRGDQQSRYAAHASALVNGWASINEIRRMEDMPPVDGGDTFRVPLANIDLDAANLVEMDKKVTIATKLIMTGFDPTDVLAKFGLPALAHTGLPSVQLQNPANLDPEDPEAQYEVE